ncbi:DNA-processing protein DprA [Hydrogenivirga sp.]
MKREEIWLRLKLTRGLGERGIKRLYDAFGSGEAILSAGHEELKGVVGERRASAILKGDFDKKLLETSLESSCKNGFAVITLEDEDYPKAFLELPDPPPVLFIKGSIKGLPSLGLVGTRRPTSYTLSLVDEVVGEAVKRGFGVVSGGARGVDARAHLATIKNSGYTLCILGFGLLKARGGLFEDILNSNGVLLSEFLPHEGGDSFTFPKRNRLIAAISDLLFVPEAGSRSGALITADHALKLGRRVYVHIGIGRSSAWDGCYKLLREGKAELVKDGRELFGGSGVPSGSGSELLNFLSAPRTLEEIASFLGEDERTVLSLLTSLEMEGKVKRVGAHYIS